jgi:hypothetical protein
VLKIDLSIAVILLYSFELSQFISVYMEAVLA